MIEQYNKLTIAARYYLQGKGYYQALDAMEFGRKLHTGFRKDGVTPEFMHQIQILHWVRTLEPSMMYPEETYVAILLHDTPEDKFEVTHAMIRDRFSPRAAQAIFLLDKNGKREIDYFHGLSQDPIGSVAKLGDRIHNFSTMVGVFTIEKQLKYVDEVEKYFMPMIKQARRTFPQQEPIYENGKHVLNIMLDMFDAIQQEPQ